MKIEIKDSSSILSIEHLAEGTSDMIVEFTSGSRYLFRQVDEQTFNNFCGAESKGKFFASSIRGKFQSEIYTADVICDLSLPRMWSWPFPVTPHSLMENATSIVPDEDVDYDRILEWTTEEEEAFMNIFVNQESPESRE
jgi:hypothetical protein